MIRVDLDEQVAIELHHGAGVLREVLAAKGADVQTDQMRDAQLALAGGLRAAGWVPDPDGTGWTRQPTRRRR